MTSEEYLKQSQVFTQKNIESYWFITEVTYYSAAGRVLDSLRNHLRFGCGIEKDNILKELSFLLKSLVDLCVCTMSHLDFIAHDWVLSREMVPAGVNGCANSILNMIRTGEPTRRIHFLANACSHMGFSFKDVATRSLNDLMNEFMVRSKVD